ncbi:MAG: CRISPR-associated DxTHG motif protein [Helicobacteraceae bacterium]|jgi:CRISPR-associated DxTHG motif protein|nr:CRISPR-associated DxTHG motif protein [Helicobacteraceae bacterium]
MKIITITGIGRKTQEGQRAYYRYDKNLESFFSLKKHNYTNMLPLLIDNFGDNVIPIFTQSAKESQILVLQDEFPQKDFDIFKDEYLIDDDKDFYSILSLINNLMSESDKYIIDLTHGFRHIPILAVISIITHTLNDASNIEHILFAKEIETQKEYEIIDLKEYLELANISYALEAFVDNYTAPHRFFFTDEALDDLNSDLKILSNCILSNSLQRLIESPILEDIISKISAVMKDKKAATFKVSLIKIKKHIEELQQLKSETRVSNRLYEFAKLLSKRGYLLNAITLLFEATGYYCLESLKSIDRTTSDYIDLYEKALASRGKSPIYAMTTWARAIVKNYKSSEDFYSPDTSKWKWREKYETISEDAKKINKGISDYLISIKDIRCFTRFIGDVEHFRNNLAHGNSSDPIKDAKDRLKGFIETYMKYCINENILGIKQ